MNISNYEELLEAANRQAEPQRLLFVFTSAELPDDCTEGQREQFRASKGGALAPVMCVAKLAADRQGFDALFEESNRTGKGWDIVFTACMPVAFEVAPGEDAAERGLRAMINSIHEGKVGDFLAFNRHGEIVRLQVAGSPSIH